MKRGLGLKHDAFEILKETAIYQLKQLQFFLSFNAEVFEGGSEDISIEDLADIGFAFREMEKKFDELRKEAKAKHEGMVKLICKRFAEQTREDPLGDHDGKVRAEFCSCSPDVQAAPKIPHPKKNPEMWKSFCEFFGVPQELADKGIISFHFIRTNEFLAQENALGNPLPNGAGATVPHFVARFTKKRGFNAIEATETLKQRIENNGK